MKETMTRQKAQNRLNEWCRQADIPTIRVKMFKEIIGCETYFSDKYYIGITPNCTFEMLFHEFVHYNIKLMKISEDLEEHICGLCVDGDKKRIEKRDKIVNSTQSRKTS